MDKFTPTIEQVHADERGEIYVVNLPGNKELILLHSVTGSLRGGHAHDCDEIVTLLTGKIAYRKRYKAGGEWEETMIAGQTSFVPAWQYHLGEFLEDSWLLEWKLAKDKSSWRNIEYQPWREKVKAYAAT